MIKLIIIGTAAMLLLAFGIILFVVMYQRRVFAYRLEKEKMIREKHNELIQASIQSEEKERARIAAELHDDIGATLSSIKLFLSTSESNDIIEQSRALLQESIEKIREISHRLQPGILRHMGLQAALESQLELLQKTGKVTTAFRSEHELPRLDLGTELSIYRICQELISNTIKHARPERLVIQAAHHASDLLVEVRHDGNGLTQQGFEEMIYKKGSTGLKNIVSRIEFIRAAILFEKDDDAMFVIKITVPILGHINS